MSREANLLGALRQARELTGATPGTQETFLAVRGARTLTLRLERAQRSAITLAERLAGHPNVMLTRYPGLASHPTHEGARRHLKGFGTIISFDARGDAAAADGPVRRAAPHSPRNELGRGRIHDRTAGKCSWTEALASDLLAVSVGIEAVEDLWADLEQALCVSHFARSSPLDFSGRACRAGWRCDRRMTDCVEHGLPSAPGRMAWVYHAKGAGSGSRPGHRCANCRLRS